MRRRRILFIICMAISTFGLAGGFWLSAQWIGVALAILTGMGWFLAWKHSASELSVICLIVSVILAVAGLLTGASSELILCGPTFALAAWDLTSLEDVLKQSAYEQQTVRYENKHLQLLVLALLAGLIMVFTGRLLHLQINFVVILVLVGLVIFGLDRVWNAIKKRNIRTR